MSPGRQPRREAQPSYGQIRLAERWPLAASVLLQNSIEPFDIGMRRCHDCGRRPLHFLARRRIERQLPPLGIRLKDGILDHSIERLTKRCYGLGRYFGRDDERLADRTGAARNVYKGASFGIIAGELDQSRDVRKIGMALLRSHCQEIDRSLLEP